MGRPVGRRRGARFITPAPDADWTEPDRAHLLDVQADMIRLYLDAWTITGADRYRDRARDAWAYVDRTLHDRENGGFFASEHAGQVDRVLLTDANARMIRTLLHASQVLDDVTLAETAARAAERIMPAVYGRGAGVAHVLDTHARVRGLLTDQVHASAAMLDLGQASGDPTYLDLSDELMRSSLRKLWDARCRRVPRSPAILRRRRRRRPARRPVPAVRAERRSRAPAANGSAVRPVTRNSWRAPPTCAGGSTETIHPRGFRAPNMASCCST